jgi:hypothetical protein
MFDAIRNFLLNLDRAAASLCGAPKEETISSEICRHEYTNPVAAVAACVLDTIQPNHVEDAMIEADKLDAVG